MSERFDGFIEKTRAPEVVAAAVGYIAGSAVFDYETPASIQHEFTHNFESSLLGVGVAVAAFGLTRIIRNLRSQGQGETN